MRRFALTLAAVVTVASSASCEKPITQLILVVDTDLRVPDAIDSVHIRVIDPTGVPTNQTVALAGDGSVSLPLSLGLVSDSDRLGPVSITVDGQLTTGADPVTVVTRSVRTTFVQDQTRVVLVRLLESCIGVSCMTEQTCNDGTCRPEFVGTSELAAWTGRISVPERCNGVDDDGDDAVDEDFDLAIDPQNCGECGHVCGAGLACSGSACVSDPVVGIAAAGSLTCAMRMSGAVACWGAGSGLGDGVGETSNRPVGVVDVNDAMALSVGTFFGCVVRRSGRVSCWGTNGGGELGNGSDDSPVLVARDAVGITDATRVVAGYFHGCALRSDGGVRCWGHGEAGQLGLGSTVPSSLFPVDVVSLSDASQIDVGNLHTCAARRTGQVACWGSGASGQLGLGDTSSQPAPVDTMFVDAAEVACGEDFTCVRGLDNRVACVGGNVYGQLGSDVSGSLTPLLVPGVTAISLAAAARGSYVCAIRPDETAVCWGANEDGQLGDGTTTTRPVPMPVVGLAGVQRLAAGTSHACALLDSGQVLCWGSNGSGELGIGGTTPSTTPVRVVGL